MRRTDITPIDQLARRMPEAGRIRLGVKAGRAMKAIDTFRFTSPHRDVIDAAAALWGGTVEAWDDTRARIRNQWQVITDTDTIDVYLVPNGLSQWYELWPGPTRRCDGITVEVPIDRGDDYEMTTAPCICAANNARECNPYLRCTLLVPTLPFRGTWRLETKGWNAHHEMPGVFEMVSMLAPGGTLQAQLHLSKREQLTPTGKKRRFVVPELSIAHSIHELQAGGADARTALSARGSLPALGPGTDADPAELPDGDDRALVAGFDDDVVDAEVVDDDELELRDLLAGDARQFGLDPDRFLHALYRTVDARGALDADQRVRLRALHTKIKAGDVEPIGFRTDGRVQWNTR